MGGELKSRDIRSVMKVWMRRVRDIQILLRRNGVDQIPVPGKPCCRLRGRKLDPAVYSVDRESFRRIELGAICGICTKKNQIFAQEFLP